MPIVVEIDMIEKCFKSQDDIHTPAKVFLTNI